MPQLDFANYPFASQIFWLFFSFAILYYFVAKLIIPKITQVINIREKTIYQAIEEAEKLKSDIANSAGSKKSPISQARAKANQILIDAKNSTQILTDKELARIEVKITKQVDQAKTEIEKFSKDQAKDCKNLSNEIYNNLLKKLLN
jgi:F-type H+-transporting ATPase subunit b